METSVSHPKDPIEVKDSTKPSNTQEWKAITKPSCIHEWKVISYYMPSCSMTCTKCGKTIL